MVGVGVVLVGGNKGGLDGQMYCGIYVFWIVDDQWVIVVYFQCEDFLWLFGQLVMQMKIGG